VRTLGGMDRAGRTGKYKTPERKRRIVNTRWEELKRSAGVASPSAPALNWIPPGVYPSRNPKLWVTRLSAMSSTCPYSVGIPSFVAENQKNFAEKSQTLSV